MRRNRPISFLIAAALGVTSFVVTPAFANGGDFFEEFAANWALGNNPDEGAPYFGFIRDTHGRPISQATASATIKPSGSGLSVQTDVLGHYKIPGFDKSINPADVVIACSKPGYRQVASERRLQRRPDMPIEVSCTLEQNRSSLNRDFAPAY